ncbi:methionine aminopeptidase 1A-like [Magnolia sinica]|uniref:methionine aminopeptidase 1A-like n=1 Tax=Magnolia sinica TaxID=86752 RepID=UPI00265A7FA2|nr:methionine aminopeptidase 1A-like [Magnolia sinica]
MSRIFKIDQLVGQSKCLGEVFFTTILVIFYDQVKSYCGHGIGELFHCAPNIPHYARNAVVGVMKAGQTFTTEPIVNPELFCLYP